MAVRAVGGITGRTVGITGWIFGATTGEMVATALGGETTAAGARVSPGLRTMGLRVWRTGEALRTGADVIGKSRLDCAGATVG